MKYRLELLLNINNTRIFNLEEKQIGHTKKPFHPPQKKNNLSDNNDKRTLN